MFTTLYLFFFFFSQSKLNQINRSSETSVETLFMHQVRSEDEVIEEKIHIIHNSSDVLKIPHNSVQEV